MFRGQLFLTIFVFGLSVFCQGTCALEKDDRPSLTIGYVRQTTTNIDDDAIGPTVEYLQEKLNDKYSFRLVALTSSNLISEIKSIKPEFLIVPSEYFIQITASEGLGAHDIAVRKTIFSSDASRSIGSAFITSKNRGDIKTIEDLKGKTVSTADTDTVGDWWAALGEIKRRGLDPENFFSEVRLAPFFFAGVVAEVLSGKSDVGILPTCALEQLQAEGLLSPGAVKVIEAIPNNREQEPFYCARSTVGLYPGTVMASMQNAPDKVVKDITVALFTMPDTNKSEWAVSNDFSEMLALMKDLKFGMFENLRDYSVKNLLKTYSTEIFIVLLVLLFLFLNELRIHRLVDKRTAQLSSALKAKEAAEQEAIEGRKRLSHIERSGVISQMSNIIAHELKQPLGALINYAAVLKLKAKQQGSGDDITAKVISNIDSEARRISSIVDSVRKFAKKEQAPQVPSDLLKITEKALRTFAQQEDPDASIPLKSSVQEAPILADPLSLELLILNIIRNGASASLSDTGKVSVKIDLEDLGNKWLLKISNKGKSLSDTQISRLSSLSESVKPEGLGLGLAIVREIADNHSAALNFERRPGGGVTASISIEKLQRKN
ncbi:PhnD/SsuA/transferrin family substrate-binding protein [uncultured Turicimonas sp.]|uniref:sensor histidine kinase n=1 Tax=uncultured Turicimonas sp. TaxID=1918607 RepID=UPI003211B195